MTRSERDEQQYVLERLRRDARILARRFGLPLRSLEAERPQVRRRYGICFVDGRIKIRLRHVKTRELLKYSSLVDTLCHELAHLRHMNHGLRFQAFYRRILSQARGLGIYRPTPRGLPGVPVMPVAPRLPPFAVARTRPGGSVRAARRRPVQLELF